MSKILSMSTRQSQSTEKTMLVKDCDYCFDQLKLAKVCRFEDEARKSLVKINDLVEKNVVKSLDIDILANCHKTIPDI